MKINDIPFYSRPDYKLINKGSLYLDDAELLAILFGNGNKNESSIELANRLLNTYNLDKLDNLSYNKAFEDFKFYRIK